MNKERLEKHGAFHEVVKDFTDKCGFSQQILGDVFPDSVTYPPVCGALCASGSDYREKGMYRALLDAFAEIATRFGIGRPHCK